MSRVRSDLSFKSSSVLVTFQFAFSLLVLIYPTKIVLRSLLSLHLSYIIHTGANYCELIYMVARQFSYDHITMCL